jgi:hypothetical protein
MGIAESTVEKHMSRGFLLMLDWIGGNDPSHPSSPGLPQLRTFDVSKDRK